MMRMRLRPRFFIPAALLSLTILLVAWPGKAEAGTVAVGDLSLSSFSLSGPIWFATVGAGGSRAAVPSVLISSSPGTPGLVVDESANPTNVFIFNPFEEVQASTAGSSVGSFSASAHSIAGADGVGKTSTDSASRVRQYVHLVTNAAGTITASAFYSMSVGLTTGTTGEKAFGTILFNIADFSSGAQNSVLFSKGAQNGSDLIDSSSGTLSLSFGVGAYQSVDIVWEGSVTTHVQNAVSPLPGQTQSVPVLPDPGSPSGAFQFSLDLGAGGLGTDFPIFVDPPVVYGFEYSVGSEDPNFASVLLPTGVDTTDATFELWLPDGSGGFIFDSILDEGVEYFFAGGGVSLFQIRDIEPLLDPDDPDFDTAFPTGLTFVSSSSATVTMTPLSESGGETPVPEPATLLLLGSGLAGLGLVRRRKKV